MLDWQVGDAVIALESTAGTCSCSNCQRWPLVKGRAYRVLAMKVHPTEGWVAIRVFEDPKAAYWHNELFRKIKPATTDLFKLTTPANPVLENV